MLGGASVVVHAVDMSWLNFSWDKDGRPQGSFTSSTMTCERAFHPFVGHKVASASIDDAARIGGMAGLRRNSSENRAKIERRIASVPPYHQE